MLIKGILETKRVWEGKGREFNFRCCFVELIIKSYFFKLFVVIFRSFVDFKKVLVESVKYRKINLMKSFFKEGFVRSEEEYKLVKFWGVKWVLEKNRYYLNSVFRIVRFIYVWNWKCEKEK